MNKATNRSGVKFFVEEDVMMADSPILYQGMTNEILTITEIKEHDTCESGFMIQVIQKSTGKPFKKMLDTNWFKKINSL